MAKSHSNYLRLYAEQAPPPSTSEQGTAELLTNLGAAFERATGWPVRFVPLAMATNEPGWSPGMQFEMESPLETDLDCDGRPSISLELASELAAQIGQLALRLSRAERALAEREAELATHVPVAHHRDEPLHLAEKLQSTIRGGAQALGCHSAALYTLDAATTELKLRAAWGLPAQRFTMPARPLKHCIADLEALAGHAVVLESARQAATWQPPEEFPSAVCVPVSTATTPLGTLWMFCGRERRFTDHEVNLAEIVAGRLAAELEREVLWHEGVAGAQLSRQFDAAQLWQQQQLPHVPPPSDVWQIAGWSQQADGMGGAFHDWFACDDGALAITAGLAAGTGAVSALTATMLRTALRSREHLELAPGAMLDRVSQTLWTCSAGDCRASAWMATLDPIGDQLLLSAGGRAQAVAFGTNTPRRLELGNQPLGSEPGSMFGTLVHTVQPGDGLLLLLCQPLDVEAEQFPMSDLLAIVRNCPKRGGLSEMIERVRDAMALRTDHSAALDFSVVALRRR